VIVVKREGTLHKNTIYDSGWGLLIFPREIKMQSMWMSSGILTEQKGHGQQ
jgi:hypothetical protein